MSIKNNQRKTVREELPNTAVQPSKLPRQTVAVKPGAPRETVVVEKAEELDDVSEFKKQQPEPNASGSSQPHFFRSLNRPPMALLTVLDDGCADVGQTWRIFQDSRKRWIIEDNHSINGLWTRIDRASLDTDSQFQLGGQRFLFKIL